MILFLTVLKFCLVFYGIYLKNIWRSFCARVGFHVSTRFVIAVGSGRGEGAANFAGLDSDFSELGKHVWTLDMIRVCMIACKFVHGIRVSVSTSLLVRQLPAFSEVAMISGERWPNHVVTWRAARWYCCSIPALRHPTFSDVNVVGATLSFFSRMFQSCDDLWWEMA